MLLRHRRVRHIGDTRAANIANKHPEPRGNSQVVLCSSKLRPLGSLDQLGECRRVRACSVQYVSGYMTTLACFRAASSSYQRMRFSSGLSRSSRRCLQARIRICNPPCSVPSSDDGHQCRNAAAQQVQLFRSDLRRDNPRKVEFVCSPEGQALSFRVPESRCLPARLEVECLQTSGSSKN